MGYVKWYHVALCPLNLSFVLWSGILLYQEGNLHRRGKLQDWNICVGYSLKLSGMLLWYLKLNKGK